MIRTLVLATSLFFLSTAHAAIVVDFESLPAPITGFYNGDPNGDPALRANYTITGTGTNFGSVEVQQLWTSGGVSFGNQFTPDFGSWNGWSWSNIADGTTPGFGNQYAALPGGGHGSGGSTNAGGTYAIGFGNGAYFNLPENHRVESLRISNTTYAGLSMRDGDDFAKRFGGLSGTDPDFLNVRFTGFDQLNLAGNTTGFTDFLLADYRSSNSLEDYIINAWSLLDLTPLGGARSVGMAFTGSDNGLFGLNTPTYLAIDDLTITAVPEPSSLALLGLASLGGVAAKWRKRRPAKPNTMEPVQ